LEQRPVLARTSNFADQTDGNYARPACAVELDRVGDADDVAVAAILTNAPAPIAALLDSSI